MDKGNSSVIEVISESMNINTCMKLLNLEINSYFICLLNILEDTILDYKEWYNYSYLVKISDYLEKTYERLSIKVRESYRINILLLRKVYKKQEKSLIKKDRVYFNNVYNSLTKLLKINKQEVVEESLENNNLYDLIDEVIFKIKKLDYLDKIIDSIPGILNLEKNNYNIFLKVIKEYIKEILINNKDNIDYYERVINKFLLEEAFDLNDQMKDNIIKTLLTFVNKKRNLDSETIKRIKFIINSINYKSNLFRLLNIQTRNPEVIYEDLSLFNYKKQLDNRIRINEHIITIDDASANVLDDAISYKKLKNGNSIFRVHIADPLAIIPFTSDTFKEARVRTSTIYNKNNTINMLPLIFSANKLSLNKNEERYAKTFCFEFDSDFNIINFYIINSVIKVSDRLTYNEYNRLYKIGGRTREEENFLIYYDNILKFLKRILSNVKYYHEEKEKLGNRHSNKNSSISEMLISYSMILTGYMTSSYFSKKNLPYIYRCNNLDLNWLNLIDKTIGNLENSNEKRKLKIVRNNLVKSYYTGTNLGHSGLGLESYSHITSPLRRYADIFNMHLLDKCYFNTLEDYEFYDLEEEIRTISKYLNMQNNTINDYAKSKCKIK